MPDIHQPRAGWTGKLRAQPQNTSSLSPHPSGPSSTPTPRDSSLLPQGSRGQGGLFPSHPILDFQGLHRLPRALPAQISSQGDRDGAGCCSEGGKAAVIHWERGNGTEQDLPPLHWSWQLTGRSESAVPLLVPVASCPRHQSLEVLGKGKKEFSKLQGQGLPGSSRLLYLFIHLLPAAEAPARHGGGKVGAGERSQERSLPSSCCWPSKPCSSSWSWKGFLP